MMKTHSSSRRTSWILIMMLSLVMTLPAAAEEIWTVDPAHSEVSFSVKHFFTPVRGTFSDLDVALQFDPKQLEKSTVTAKIPIGTVDTKNGKRDSHLKSADFFEADAHPYMTFRTTSVKPDGEDRFIATGELTLKGVTKTVKLPIEILGIKDIPEQMQPMIGATQVASFRGATSIDRNDFEVGTGSWAATAVVGDTVDIEILIEAHRK